MKMKKVFSKVVTFLMVFTFVFGAIGVITPEKVKAAEPLALTADLPVGDYAMVATKNPDNVTKALYPVSSKYDMFAVWYVELHKTSDSFTADIALCSTSFSSVWKCNLVSDKSDDIKVDKEELANFVPPALKALATEIKSTNNLQVVFKNLPVIASDDTSKGDFKINLLTTTKKGEEDVSLYINKLNIKALNNTNPEAKVVGDFIYAQPKTDPDPDPEEPKEYKPIGTPKQLTDGRYTIGYFNATPGSTGTMLSIEDTVISIDNKKITADISMKSSSGFNALYVGKAEDASIEKAISPVIETKIVDGQPLECKVYKNVPISVLDGYINIALYSTKNKAWYDRIVVFDSSTAKETNLSVIVKDKTETKINLNESATKSGEDAVIELKTGSVAFDNAALKEIIEATGGAAVTITLDEVTESTTFKDKGYDKVISIKLTATDGTPLFTKAANGKATITIPYDKAVEEGKTVKVYYVTDGKEEEVEATYDADAKTVTFTLAHFSEYAIKQVDATDATTTADAPKTGDNSMVALIAILMLMAGATVVTMRRKRA